MLTLLVEFDEIGLCIMIMSIILRLLVHYRRRVNVLHVAYGVWFQSKMHYYRV